MTEGLITHIQKVDLSTGIAEVNYSLKELIDSMAKCVSAMEDFGMLIRVVDYKMLMQHRKNKAMVKRLLR